jgi:hypothetical protein
VAISNAYYVNNRTAHQAAAKLSMQLGVDAAGNILKEFWPDFERKFGRHHRHGSAHLQSVRFDEFPTKCPPGGS